MVKGMDTAGTDELITVAAAALRRHKVGDRVFGDLAAPLISEAGHRFSGVCIDTGSGTGFCAEAGAIAAMVTAGQYRINAIVAVWRDEQDRLYVLPRVGGAGSSFARSTRPTWTRR
jgi:cytidine deaminase